MGITHAKKHNAMRDLAKIRIMNEAIAEFYDDFGDISKLWDDDRAKYMEIMQLRMRDNKTSGAYHKDWELLMKVVEKIEAIDDYVVYIYHNTAQITHFNEHRYDDKLTAAHTAVYEFCDWYITNEKLKRNEKV